MNTSKMKRSKNIEDRRLETMDERARNLAASLERLTEIRANYVRDKRQDMVDTVDRDFERSKTELIRNRRNRAQLVRELKGSQQARSR